MRAVRVPLESSLTPAQAVLALRGTVGPFALVGEWAGGGAVLGCSPELVAGDPFSALDDLVPVDAGDAVVGGGWFGVIGYRLGEEIERLPPAPPAPVPTPASSLAFYDHVALFDGERWWLEALNEEIAERELPSWRARLGGPAQAPGSFSAGPFAAVAPGEAGLEWAVEDCVRRIAEGELFQANLTLRLEAEFAGSELDVFAAALERAQPRFGACFEGVVSLSPERFLRRVGRHVESDPIKGTAADPETLRASAKDAAEHVMIVDLMRNDLGRVCEYGSIAAAEPRLEAHANVWHMVSTVSGELREDATDADLLRATFPPGSVTGAPKVQAMKVISELEPTRREAYTGAIGYASPIAGLELSVAIRTFEIAAGRIWLGAGGGIVADSNPQAELAEALAKAAGPLSAIDISILPAMRAKLRSRRVPRALDLAPRPDPRGGLLETILVDGGQPQALEQHLARLAASAEELYDLGLPISLAEQVRVAARAATTHRSRLRITLSPTGATTVQLLPLVANRPPVALTHYVLPGGLGRHKWADRRINEALGSNALLIDADGAVLEATWANVFIQEGDALTTPPNDGRILPGTHRARINAIETPFDLDRLEAADAVYLTSALRAPVRVGRSSRTSPVHPAHA